jgi:hypothetical protein
MRCIKTSASCTAGGWGLIVMRHVSIICFSLICLSGCPSTSEDRPSGPIARFGNAPALDGAFDSGEWDDAEVVRADTIEQFRMKHDGVNLYFAIPVGGGELRFNTAAGLRILHWSAQLGSAEYTKSDTLTQLLDKPFAFELRGLQKESPAVIHETLAGYLAENGWAASTASMGNLMQSEVAVSFDWLGVSIGPGGFAELPGVRIAGGLMITRDDPRADELMALPREELRRQYPSVVWPEKSDPNESLGMDGCPDTVHIDPTDFGRIWIDPHR